MPTEMATRRNVFKAIGKTGLAAALFADAGFGPAMAQALAPAGKPMKAAFSNAGLQATWCAQGKQAAEAWGKLMNVEITWFGRNRRLAKDIETTLESSTAWLLLASIQLMTRRLANP